MRFRLIDSERHNRRSTSWNSVTQYTALLIISRASYPGLAAQTGAPQQEGWSISTFQVTPHIPLVSISSSPGLTCSPNTLHLLLWSRPLTIASSILPVAALLHLSNTSGSTVNTTSRPLQSFQLCLTPQRRTATPWLICAFCAHTAIFP